MATATAIGRRRLRRSHFLSQSFENAFIFRTFRSPAAGEKALTTVIQEAYIQGASTRSVDNIVKSMAMSGVAKSLVPWLCEEIYERVTDFLQRPIECE